MKFSDIIKKKDETPADPKAPESTVPTPVSVNATVPPAASVPPPTTATSFPKSTSLPMTDETPEAIEQRVAGHALKATEVYTELIAVIRSIYRNAQNGTGTCPSPQEPILKLMALVQSGNEETIALADRSSPDNYLYAHVLNVAIFALRLGTVLKLSKDDLYSLALGSLLHDIGMVRCMDTILKNARLSEAEKADIRQHPIEGQKYLSLFPDLTGQAREQVAAIIVQHHERAVGTGYPYGLRGESIHKSARIVGVCDVYEAVTHVRPWRQRALPHEALRLLIDRHEQEFEPGIVKLLIESLSLYPPGSYVRLNSGDVGRVLFTSPGLPTRPVVRLIVDSRGERIAAARVINLATQPILYVAEAVDETRLVCTDQKMLLELRAQRWWVKGL